jgi:thymidylate synthase
MYTKGIITELLWFLRGDTNIKYLVDNDCNIWVGDAYKAYLEKVNFSSDPNDRNSNLLSTENDIGSYTVGNDFSISEFIDKIKTDDEFAKKWGNLGPIYGKQWRSWGGYKDFTNTGFLHNSDKGWCIRFNESFFGDYDFEHLMIEDDDQLLYKNEDEGRKVSFKKIIIGYDESTFSPVQLAKVIDDKVIYVGGIDQIQNAINDLLNNPDSRRIMVSAWNPAEVDKAVLPPCHYGFQLYTRELTMEERLDEWAKRHNGRTLEDWDAEWEVNTSYEEDLDFCKIPKRAISLMWNQRSCDVPLGIPYNIASYGILLSLFGKIANMVPDELIGNLGDCHIYLNQIEGCKEQIAREPYELPTLNINTEFWPTETFECGIGPLHSDINVLNENMLITDFTFENYQAHPTIKFPLSN